MIKFCFIMFNTVSHYFNQNCIHKSVLSKVLSKTNTEQQWSLALNSSRRSTLVFISSIPLFISDNLSVSGGSSQMMSDPIQALFCLLSTPADPNSLQKCESSFQSCVKAQKHYQEKRREEEEKHRVRANQSLFDWQVFIFESIWLWGKT